MAPSNNNKMKHPNLRTSQQLRTKKSKKRNNRTEVRIDNIRDVITQNDTPQPQIPITKSVSSRVIVRNLPKYFTEANIRRFFSAANNKPLTVTDVKLLSNKTGDLDNKKSQRCCCFIGFKTEHEAKTAVEFYNHSYMDTCKISVDVALPKGHIDLHRPWSRYSFGSSAHRKSHPYLYTKPQENISNNAVNDTQPRDIGSANRLNDNSQNEPAVTDSSSQTTERRGPFIQPSSPAITSEGKSIDETALQKLGEDGRLFLTNFPHSTEDDEIRMFMMRFGEIRDVQILRNKDTGESRGVGWVTYVFPSDATKAYENLISPIDGSVGYIFQGRLLKVFPAVSSKMANDSNNIPTNHKHTGATSSYKRKLEQRKKEAAEDERMWSLLYISSNAATDAAAKSLGVEKSELLDMTDDDLAVRVSLAETNIIQQTKAWLNEEGINVHAFERRGFVSVNCDLPATTKRSRRIVIFKHLPFNTSQHDLMSLVSRYGRVDRFCMSPSKTVALVSYSDSNTASMSFKKLAFISFQNVPLYLEWAPEDIFTAKTETTNGNSMDQQNNNYHNKTDTGMPSTPIVGNENNSLNELSSDIDCKETICNDLSKDKNDIPKSLINTIPQEDWSDNDLGQGLGQDEGHDEGDSSISSCVFVKNLNFKTTEESFKNHFAVCEGYRFSLIRKSRPPKTTLNDNNTDTIPQQQPRSLGYGHVEFATYTDAVNAIKRLQGQVIDDHAIQLELSNSKPNRVGKIERPVVGHYRKSTEPIDIKKISNKLVVRNLAFEASKKELRNLFSACGTVVSCRIPKKGDGRTRGYGFVEFISKKEALHALETLQHSHFYGRHMIIEPSFDAKTTVVESQMKTAREVSGMKALGEAKKRRLLTGLNDSEGDAGSFFKTTAAV